jgi:hypothetical protein
MEYVSPEKRTIVGNVPLAVFLTLGAGSLPWIAYALADWRLFSIITSAPIAVIVVAWWLVPESARWLVLKGKTDKTMETLRKCARINNKTVDPSVYEEFQVFITSYYHLLTYSFRRKAGIVYSSPFSLGAITGGHQEDLPAGKGQSHQLDGSLPLVENAPTLSHHHANLVSPFSCFFIHLI